MTSSTNSFSNVLPGVTLEINGVTGQPVSVTVANDGSNIATDLQTFVSNYNSFMTQYNSDTAYNTTTETGGVLNDDGSAIVIGGQLSQLLTTQFTGSGPVRSLADVGITVQSDGSLSFNQKRSTRPGRAIRLAVQSLFTTARRGSPPSSTT